MGSSLSFLKEWWNRAPPMRIMCFGLDAAGKTSILYRLKLGQLVGSIPTIGFNVETVTCGNVNFTIWDVGGGPKVRPLYYHYYTEDLQAAIWVIDSADKDRFPEVKEEFNAMVSHVNLKGIRLLIFNTKSDLENSTPSAEIAEYLGLKAMHREWCIITCSAKTGIGIWEGLEILRLSITGEKAMNGEIM